MVAELDTSTPVVPNYVTKDSVYWWVTFQNVINLDLMEAIVTVTGLNSALNFMNRARFPIQKFLDYLDVESNRRTLSPSKRGILGRVPVAGPIPFMQEPSAPTKPDYLQIAIKYFNGAKPKPMIVAKLIEENPQSKEDIAVVLQAFLPNIIQMVDIFFVTNLMVIADNQYQVDLANYQLELQQFQELKEEQPEGAQIYATQILNNFNGYFNTQFNFDNEGNLFNAGPPNNIVLINAGKPLQLFRVVDFIEMSDYYGKPPSLKVPIKDDDKGKPQEEGEGYYSESIMKLIIDISGD